MQAVVARVDTLDSSPLADLIVSSFVNSDNFSKI